MPRRLKPWRTRTAPGKARVATKTSNAYRIPAQRELTCRYTVKSNWKCMRLGAEICAPVKRFGFQVPDRSHGRRDAGSHGLCASMLQLQINNRVALSFCTAL